MNPSNVKVHLRTRSGNVNICLYMEFLIMIKKIAFFWGGGDKVVYFK